jgi:hypothetical protein
MKLDLTRSSRREAGSIDFEFITLLRLRRSREKNHCEYCDCGSEHLWLGSDKGS